MRKVLIIYGTVEGQTRKIAEFMATEAQELGYAPTLHDATAAPPDFATARFDRIIVAAPVHMERHPIAVEHFVRQHLAALKAVPSAFLSVSLSAAGDAEDVFTAWTWLRAFLSDVDWRPSQTLVVAGALRFTEQDFLKRWLMKWIAKEKGAPRDTDRDYEYTDWAALTSFLKEFLGADAIPTQAGT